MGEIDRWSWQPSAVSRPARRAFRVVWHHLVVEDALDDSDRFDAVFCFGSRHHRVPERAIALHRERRADRILLTGGPARVGEPTEADLFASQMVAAGVDPEHLVLEPAATNTAENVELGMAALSASMPEPVERLLLVAWPLAARRVLATFGRHHPEVEVRSAPALRQPGWRWCPTPKRVRLAVGELDRLASYGECGWIEPVEVGDEVLEATAVLRAELARWGAVGRAADVDSALASAVDAALGEVEAARAGSEAEEQALVVVEP